MYRISGSLWSVLPLVFSFPCVQTGPGNLRDAHVGGCFWQRLRGVSLLPERFLSPCLKLLLPALAPGLWVGWQDSLLGKPRQMEGQGGGRSSSTGVPCWSEVSSSVESYVRRTGSSELHSPNVELARPCCC